LQYLANEKASRTGILEAMDAIASVMRKSPADEDVAVILVSSHGEMIEGQFYLVPLGGGPSGGEIVYPGRRRWLRPMSTPRG
jgi:hypothetical protein